MSTETPRPENPALLAAIVAHPDEDTPRLMYADWLDENGDPARAEFIRLHIEWDRRPPYSPPNDDLKQRLIAAWEAAGLSDPAAEYTRRRLRGYHAYERGFHAVGDCEFDWNNVPTLSESACGAAPIRVLYATRTQRAANPNRSNSPAFSQSQGR